jgi:hypothetical protein
MRPSASMARALFTVCIICPHSVHRSRQLSRPSTSSARDLQQQSGREVGRETGRQGGGG